MNSVTLVLLAAGLAFLKPGGKGALLLWPLFGALNQLLASLGLGVATIYLFKKGRNYWLTLIPMLFMLGMTVWAMALNLEDFMAAHDTILTYLSLLIFALTGWMLVGALSSLKGQDV